MILKKIKVDSGVVDLTNCYIVQDEKTKETMVLDPGAEPEKILDMLDILDAKVKYIYLTHCHSDHIGAVNSIKEKYKDALILIHRFDSDGLNDPNINLGFATKYGEIRLEADSRMDDGDLIHIGDIEFKVLHTPGHTKGGTCLYNEKYNLVFTGDTLFRGTWGRTDCPTGSREEIIDSIINKLLVLKDDTMCYPGHGNVTEIGQERPIYLELKPRIY